MSVLTLLALLAVPVSVALCLAAIVYLWGHDSGYLRARRDLRADRDGG